MIWSILSDNYIIIHPFWTNFHTYSNALTAMIFFTPPLPKLVSFAFSSLLGLWDMYAELRSRFFCFCIWAQLPQKYRASKFVNHRGQTNRNSGYLWLVTIRRFYWSVFYDSLIYELRIFGATGLNLWFKELHNIATTYAAITMDCNMWTGKSIRSTIGFSSEGTRFFRRYLSNSTKHR